MPSASTSAAAAMSGEEKKSARFEFPSILYDMLEDVTEDPTRAPFVSWMPHGYAFRVHDGNKFETDVMPDYFRERYSSFRFLLEQWGFVGLRKGKDRGAYYNVKFVRGKRHQIATVTKKEMLAAMSDEASARDEPDFYSIPPAVWTKSQKSAEEDGQAKAKSNQTVKSKSSEPTGSKKASRSTKKGSAAWNDQRTHKSGDNLSLHINKKSSQPSDESRSSHQSQSRKKKRSAEPLRLSNKRSKASAASTSNDDLTMSEGESGSKLSGQSSRDSSTMLLAPTNAVFSGFNLPSKNNTKLIIVRTAEDLGGEEPFHLKRPMSVSQ